MGSEMCIRDSSYAVAAKPSPWYRNGIGDECVYVERGRARVETVFGSFDVAEGSLGVERFDELAVMVDTFRPLELGEGGLAVDDGVYAMSWSQGLGRPGAASPGLHSEG